MPCSSAEQVNALCDGLASPQARTKYGSAKQLIRLSERDPDLLYSRFDFFTGLMEGEAWVKPASCVQPHPGPPGACR